MTKDGWRKVIDELGEVDHYVHEHYNPAVRITIAGEPCSNPELAATLLAEQLLDARKAVSDCRRALREAIVRHCKAPTPGQRASAQTTIGQAMIAVAERELDAAVDRETKVRLNLESLVRPGWNSGRLFGTELRLCMVP